MFKRKPSIIVENAIWFGFDRRTKTVAMQKKHRALPSNCFFFFFFPRTRDKMLLLSTTNGADFRFVFIARRVPRRAGRPFVRAFIRTCISWETRRRQLLTRFFLFLFLLPRRNTRREHGDGIITTIIGFGMIPSTAARYWVIRKHAFNWFHQSIGRERRPFSGGNRNKTPHNSRRHRPYGPYRNRVEKQIELFAVVRRAPQIDNNSPSTLPYPRRSTGARRGGLGDPSKKY